MRYKMVLSYDGQKYSGWQKQINAISVEEVVEKSFADFLNISVDLVASGRTDAAVSAMMQVVHFDYADKIDCKKITGVLNANLPANITILSCEEVQDSFHARFGVVEKTYLYNFYVGKKRSAYLDKFCAYFNREIDLDLFKQNAKMIVGKHDFTSFCASASKVVDKHREIYNVELKENDGFLTFKITGGGFLYNMVRIIVGTLMDISCGKITNNIEDIIKLCDRKCAGVTAPACGLVLYEVKYNN